MNAQNAWRATILVLVLGVMAVQYRQFRVLERMAETMTDVEKNTLTTSWKSGGHTHTVTTKRNLGESDSALLVRHTNEVIDALADFPIDT